MNFLIATLTGLTGSLTPALAVLLLVAGLLLLLRFRVLPFGLSFETNDDMLKYLIAIGFLDPAGGVKLRVQAKATSYTVVYGTDPSGTIFTNRGASGAVTFTLPAAAQARKGVFYRFVGIADQNIVVAAATADTLVVINDLEADSLAIQTSSVKIGAEIEVFCDGTNWIAKGTNVGVGGTAATYTVATA